MEEACTWPIVPIPIGNKKPLTQESGVQCEKNCIQGKTSSPIPQKVSSSKEGSQKQLSQVLEHLDMLKSAQELQQHILLAEEKMNVQETEIQILKELQDEEEDVGFILELYR